MLPERFLTNVFVINVNLRSFWQKNVVIERKGSYMESFCFKLILTCHLSRFLYTTESFVFHLSFKVIKMEYTSISKRGRHLLFMEVLTFSIEKIILTITERALRKLGYRC